MSTLELRIATPDDAEAVSALLDASYPTLLASWYDPVMLARALPGMTTVNPELLACGTWYVVVDEHGEVVGCGGWTTEHPNTSAVEPGLAHMRHFATHPKAVRRGIGRMIAERSFEDARKRGITRFECFSTLAAEPFYASLGFESVSKMTIEHGPVFAFPCVLMRRG